MKFNIYIPITLSFLIMGSYIKTAEFMPSMPNVTTGDLNFDFSNFFNVDTTTCNTNVSHQCTNTNDCNINIGPCKAVQTTTTKTTTSTKTAPAAQTMPTEIPSSALTLEHPITTEIPTEPTPTPSPSKTPQLNISGQYGPVKGSFQLGK